MEFNPEKRKHVYAIVHKDETYMPLIQPTLPIYWEETEADERVKGFTDCKVIKIEAQRVFQLIKPKA